MADLTIWTPYADPFAPISPCLVQHPCPPAPHSPRKTLANRSNSGQHDEQDPANTRDTS